MANVMKTNGSIFPKSLFFDDAVRRDWFDWVFSDDNQRSSIPAVNIKETDKDFELQMAAPGMDKKDFKIELDHNRLTISLEKKNEKKEEGTYSRREFNYQYFKRSFTLPENDIETDKISARYEDGILYLSVPKLKEEAKPSRMIEIG
jgi:HSP20 family protein